MSAVRALGAAFAGIGRLIEIRRTRRLKISDTRRPAARFDYSKRIPLWLDKRGAR